jgi:hypothetical protein
VNGERFQRSWSFAKTIPKIVAYLAHQQKDFLKTLKAQTKAANTSFLIGSFSEAKDQGQNSSVITFPVLAVLYFYWKLTWLKPIFLKTDTNE